MGIEQFTSADFEEVVEFFTQQGQWVDRWEFDFLLKASASGCYLYREQQRLVALVTAVKYETSGWIGNLFVTKERRGAGIGTALTEAALDALASLGVTTYWLAATEAGEPIYKKLGFAFVDRIHQWFGFGRQGSWPASVSAFTPKMIEQDQAAWGHKREKIVSALGARGRVFAGKDGFLIAHEWNGFVRLGPWVGSDRVAAEELLDLALTEAGAARPVLAQVPSRNVAACVLLMSRNFKVIGSTSLMCRGGSSGYLPAEIYSLALGTIG
jgi:GNAT superfamily N-acetyltransferase